MNNTEKKDWLNDFLSEKGFLVSSHLSMNEMLGLEKETDISIRFMGNRRISFFYFLIILAPSNLIDKTVDDLTNNQKVIDLLHKFNSFFDKELSILVLENGEDFQSKYYTSLDSKSYTFHDNDTLSNFFSGLHNDFTSNIGSSKEINKTVNDIFQAWTRAYLSKFITVNDFDVVWIDKTAYILELKRVEEDIDTWEPYLDDSSNYIACQQIINQSNINPKVGKFLTIVYNENQSDLAGVFVFTNISKDLLQGYKSICNPNEIFRTKFQIPFSSTRRRVRRRY